MTCTECKRETKSTTTDYWRRIKGVLVVVIGPDEHLCRRCSSKRPLYRSLKQIHDTRK